ncbi:hypothetical protein [Rathayibacter sp. SD072]|uniref:hypothetical protein n=1 Tax=Rathayibacter sp. SD072 TaxID=2781731 RepID=UPI001A9725FB|nr:hypothetical protein [Rathayibacter sp. SD072]MBO0985751.1 hypothetical protein [Rathayibacter sp. SD072]
MTSRDLLPSSGSADGVQRRTLVAGAAWTIPVVATAIGAPLAAASPSPTLVFTNGPYAAAACGTLKDVVVAVTTDGTTAAPDGTLVTVTLPAGLAWSDGGSGSRAVAVGANGELVLSGITATQGSGTRTIQAALGSGAASAPVAVSSTGSTFQWTTFGGTVNPAGAPAGSTPITYNTYIDPAGNLWINGTQRASGLDPATTVATTTDTAQMVNWIDPTTGQGYQWLFTQNASPSPVAMPAGSKWLTYNIWLDPSGNLIVNGNQVAGGIDPDKVVAVTTDTAQLVTWTDATTGATFQWTTFGGTVNPAGAPAGSTPITYNTYIDPAGNLWINGTQRASGLDPATTVAVTTDTAQMVNWIDPTTGQGYQWLFTQNASPSPVTMPAGSKWLTYNIWLDPSGNLIVNGNQVAGGIDPEKVVAVTNDNAQEVTWTAAGCS